MRKRLDGIEYFVENEIFSFDFVYLRLINNVVTTCFIYCNFTVKLKQENKKTLASSWNKTNFRQQNRY